MSLDPRPAIYAIVCIPTSRVYIGSTKNAAERIATHLKRLRLGRHENRFVQRAWNKYGSESFRLDVVEWVDSEIDLLGREQAWIDSTERLFNTNKIAGRPPSMKGVPHSATHRSKISVALKGRICSSEAKSKMSAAQRQRAADGRMPKMSTERRLAQSRYRKEHPELMVACHSTRRSSDWRPDADVRRRMSESHKARWAILSDDERSRQTVGIRKPLSDAARVKISAALKGRQRSAEHCARISASTKARLSDPARRAELSERARANPRHRDYATGRFRSEEATDDNSATQNVFVGYVVGSVDLRR